MLRNDFLTNKNRVNTSLSVLINEYDYFCDTMRKNTLYILLSILLLTFVYSCEKQENGFEIIEGGVYSSGSFHDRSTDYQWDKTKIVDIAFNDRTISVSPENITIRENTVIIDKAGTYRLSGTLTDGQIVVDVNDKANVTLILNGVSVVCSSGSPLFIKKAQKTVIYLEQGTENSFTDEYSYLSGDKATASIFSNSYLTFFGKGTCEVIGQHGDGISSEKGILIKSGKFVISAKDDGIVGKEYLVIDGGNFTIDSGDDGVCCGGDLDVNRDDHEGVISGADFSLYIQGGYLFVNSGGYGINVKGSIEMTDGEVVISGPTEPDKGAIEYDDSFVITGGTLIAVGNGSNEKPYTTSLSSQYGIYAFLSNNGGIAANTFVSLQDNQGRELVTISNPKPFGFVMFVMPEIRRGSTYTLYYGGTSTGTKRDVVYVGGEYTPGKKFGKCTVNGILTRIIK